MPINQITVLFFGPLAEQAGVKTLQLVDQLDTDMLLTTLKAQYPFLGQSPYQLAMDLEIIVGNIKFEKDHTIAKLPPYAGG